MVIEAARGCDGFSKLSAEEEGDRLCGEAAPPAIGPLKSNPRLDLHAGGPWWRGRAALALAGVAALLACALLLALPGGAAKPAPLRQAAEATESPPEPVQKQIMIEGSCEYAMMPTCPALSLLDNPEVLEVASKNLVSVGHQILKPKDRHMVHNVVAVSFKNISTQLGLRAPEVASALQLVQLSQEDKDAVLRSLRLISDPRVQKIGLEVARAIRGSASSHRDTVKRRIEERLRPRLREILELRRELVPSTLRRLWGEGHTWDMTLDPENVMVMERVSDEFETSYDPRKAVDLSEKDYGLYGGVLEEARALLDVMRACMRLFSKDLKVPEWATSLGGNMVIGPELLSCELDPIRDSRMNFMKALFCPLKFGTQGVDALRAAPDMAREAAVAPKS